MFAISARWRPQEVAWWFLKARSVYSARACWGTLDTSDWNVVSCYIVLVNGTLKHVPPHQIRQDRLRTHENELKLAFTDFANRGIASLCRRCGCSSLSWPSPGLSPAQQVGWPRLQWIPPSSGVSLRTPLVASRNTATYRSCGEAYENVAAADEVQDHLLLPIWLATLDKTLFVSIAAT